MPRFLRPLATAALSLAALSACVSPGVAPPAIVLPPQASADPAPAPALTPPSEFLPLQAGERLKIQLRSGQVVYMPVAAVQNGALLSPLGERIALADVQQLWVERDSTQQRRLWVLLLLPSPLPANLSGLAAIHCAAPASGSGMAMGSPSLGPSSGGLTGAGGLSGGASAGSAAAGAAGAAGGVGGAGGLGSGAVGGAGGAGGGLGGGSLGGGLGGGGGGGGGGGFSLGGLSGGGGAWGAPGLLLVALLRRARQRLYRVP